MRDRRFKPNVGRHFKQRSPSQLSGLDGSRRAGDTLRVHAPSKAPKIRFRPGDCFKFDGECWKIIYMYRLKDRPGEWIHTLEIMERDRGSVVSACLTFLGAGASTARIVFNEFPTGNDARDYFRDIAIHGSCVTHQNTKSLIAAKQITEQEGFDFYTKKKGLETLNSIENKESRYLLETEEERL